MPVDRIRCGVVTQRRHYRQVGFTGLYEFEDLIVDEFTNGTLLFPDPVPRAQMAARKLDRGVRSRFGFETTESNSANAEFDVIVVPVRNPFEVDALDAMPDIFERAKQVVCFVVEVWPKHVRDWKLALQGLNRFDHVFVGLENGVSGLRERLDTEVSYSAPAVDTERFWPGLRPPARVIDMCSFGRMSPATHAAMFAFAEEHNRFYSYSTTSNPMFVDAATHRGHHADLLRRSKFSIANYAKFNSDAETEGVQEVGYRFFECAAAGALMLGKAPDNPLWEQYFPYESPIVDLPFDAPHIGDVITELEADPDELERRRTVGIQHSLRHNDWVHRWIEMMDALGLDSEAPQQRVARLAEFADQTR